MSADPQTSAAPPVDKSALRNAATTILLRDTASGRPSVLMGQRGAGAAFMPDKFVFPGGAVDPADASVPLATPLSVDCAARLATRADPALIPALAAAAIRELWEETGLILGTPGQWPGEVPDDWQGFAAAGFLPDAAPLNYVFRAITPVGRPRRFDARFFVADADRLATDPDDFSRASDELSALQWIPLAEARGFNLPFITEVVLAELAGLAASGNLRPASVPFFDNLTPRSIFHRIP